MRRCRGCRTTQRQAQAHLSEMGNAVRDLQSDTSVRRFSAARRQHGRTGKLRSETVRHRGRYCHAAGEKATAGRHCQTQRVIATPRNKTPERGGNDGRMERGENQKQVSLPYHRPWKSLLRFPPSHRPAAVPSLSKPKTERSSSLPTFLPHFRLIFR